VAENKPGTEEKTNTLRDVEATTLLRTKRVSDILRRAQLPGGSRDSKGGKTLLPDDPCRGRDRAILLLEVRTIPAEDKQLPMARRRRGCPRKNDIEPNRQAAPKRAAVVHC
jgi:hypothetical protein